MVCSGEWIHTTDRQGYALETYRYRCFRDPNNPHAPVGVARPR